jgi:hypothetical protein
LRNRIKLPFHRGTNDGGKKSSTLQIRTRAVARSLVSADNESRDVVGCCGAAAGNFFTRRPRIFEKKIRPVLVAQCYQCHSASAKKPAGGLLLDSREAMLKGGASGLAAIVPNDPEASLLLQAIRYTNPKLQMPMSGKLPDEVIQDFEAWIKIGAPDPRDTNAATTKQPYDFTAAKTFWSFQPLKSVAVPAVQNQAWVRTPLDNFILAKLEEKQL